MKLWQIFIFVTLLFALDCSSKSAKPINLQLGISLDPAERLTRNAGWICDSIQITKGNGAVLRFKDVQLSNVDYPLEGMLTFRNDSLSTFNLYERPPQSLVILRLASSQPLLTIKHYSHVVAAIESVYGTPTDSGYNARILSPNFVSLNHDIDKDTTFSTEWRDTSQMQKNKLYDVSLSTIGGGSVSFGGSYYRKETVLSLQH